LHDEKARPSFTADGPGRVKNPHCRAKCVDLAACNGRSMRFHRQRDCRGIPVSKISPRVAARSLELLEAHRDRELCLACLRRGSQQRFDRSQPRFDRVAVIASEHERLCARRSGAGESGQGDYENAAAAAGTSAEQAELAGQPLQVGRSRLLEGIALSRAGSSPRPWYSCGARRRHFAAHGAVRYRDRAAQEVRKLGIRAVAPRREDREERAIGSFSRRELTVARPAGDARRALPRHRGVGAGETRRETA